MQLHRNLLLYHDECSLVREKLIGLFSYFLANFVMSSLLKNFSRTRKMLLAIQEHKHIWESLFIALFTDSASAEGRDSTGLKTIYSYIKATYDQQYQDSVDHCGKGQLNLP